MDYMLKVFKKVFNGKYSIADPNGFKSKLKQVNKEDRVNKLKRLGTTNSTVLGDGSTTGRSFGDQTSNLKTDDAGSSNSGEN